MNSLVGLDGDSQCGCLGRVPRVAVDNVDRRLTGSKGTKQDRVRSSHRRQDFAIIPQDRWEKCAQYLDNVIPGLNVAASRIE